MPPFWSRSGLAKDKVHADFGYTTQEEAIERRGARLGAMRRGKLRTMGITVSIPHKLGRPEARRRIETGFAKILRQVSGSAGTCGERWEGDRLFFEVRAMGQTISGIVDVLDDAVTMDIELPRMLALLAGALKNKLESAGQLLLK